MKIDTDKLTPIFVRWVDAESIDQWEAIEDIDLTLARIETLGWLIRESKDALYVSLNHDTKNSKASCTMVIPKAFIEKSKRFKNAIWAEMAPKRGRNAKR